MDEWSSSRFFNMAKEYYLDNREKILDLLEENEKGRLLDIGCDDGKFIGLKNIIKKKKSIMNHYSHDKIIY